MVHGLGSSHLPDDVVLSARSVSKKFCKDLRRSMLYGVQDLARDLFGLRPRDVRVPADPAPRTPALRRDEFWALQDVSFDLKKGESLGIIGPNGSGKTTLLRILTGILPPDTGSVAFRGRIGGMIALGAGMHPHLTGRENIYLKGAVIGMSKAELEEKFGRIVEFSELGDFIDAPVATYSSGMQVRLGFSVAVHGRPDILVVDEVLSVGDLRFRRKARNAMSRLLEDNTALIFISHNIHEVLGLTERALWLELGRIREDGDSARLCGEYLRDSQASSFGRPGTEGEFEYMQKITGDLAVTGVSCLLSGQPLGRRVTVVPGDRGGELVIDVAMQARDELAEPVNYGIGIVTLDGTKVGYSVIADTVKAARDELVHRRFSLSLGFLHPGQYKVAFAVGTEGGPRLEGVNDLVYLDIQTGLPPAWAGESENLNYARMLSNVSGSVVLPVKLVREEGSGKEESEQ